MDGNIIRISRFNYGSAINEYRSYDAAKQLLSVKDHSGNVWAYTYDLLGNRLTATDPDLGNWSYVYDDASQLMSQTDARGIETSLTYDALGRLLTKTDTATGEVYVTNTYDEVVANSFNKGRLTTAANDNGIHNDLRP